MFKPERIERHARHPLYWRSYHSSNFPFSWIIKLIQDVVAELGPPWEMSSRGRPPKFSPERHAFFCILTSYMNWSLRTAEAFLDVLGVSIDHSTIGKAYHRLPEGYIVRAIRLLNSKVSVLLGRSRLYVCDASGLACDRSKRKVVRALEEAWVTEYEKLHLVVELREGLLCIADARATEGEAHEAPLVKQMLSEGEIKEGYMLGDKAFDVEGIYRECFEHGLVPVIKRKTSTKRGRFRRKASKLFSQDVYRLRGIGEGVFGAIEVKFGAKIRAKKAKARRVAALMQALAFNISAFMRAVAYVLNIARVTAQEKATVLCFIQIIIRQPLLLRKV